MDGVTKLWTRSKVFQTVKSVKTYREGVRKGQIEEDKRGFHWGRGVDNSKTSWPDGGHSACRRGAVHPLLESSGTDPQSPSKRPLLDFQFSSV